MSNKTSLERDVGLQLSFKDNDILAERQTKDHKLRALRNKTLISFIEKTSSQSGIKEKLQLEIQFMSHELDTLVTTNNAKNVVKNALSAAYRAVEAAELSASFEKYEAVIIGRGYRKGDFDAEGLPNDPVRQFIQSRKTSLRNSRSSPECSPTEDLYFEARQKLMDSLDKEYRQIQRGYVEKYLGRHPKADTTNRIFKNFKKSQSEPER